MTSHYFRYYWTPSHSPSLKVIRRMSSSHKTYSPIPPLKYVMQFFLANPNNIINNKNSALSCNLLNKQWEKDCHFFCLIFAIDNWWVLWAACESENISLDVILFSQVMSLYEYFVFLLLLLLLLLLLPKMYFQQTNCSQMIIN